MNEFKLSDFVEFYHENQSSLLGCFLFVKNKECDSMNVLESIFKTFISLGGQYHDRLNANKGLTFYLNKDEALDSLRDFDAEMFVKKDIELYLNDLNFPIIAIPIMAYDGEINNIPRYEYKDWLFDINSCREEIKEIAKEYRVPIYTQQ